MVSPSLMEFHSFLTGTPLPTALREYCQSMYPQLPLILMKMHASLPEKLIWHILLL